MLRDLGVFFCALSLAGSAYGLLAATLAGKLRKAVPPPPADATPPVSVLRPLHGLTAGLETALASLTVQTYPAPVQIVLGVQDANDPARHAAGNLRQEYPEADIALVVNEQNHGQNRKISNLINVFGAAKHDVLVLSDADIEAPPDWLAAVVQALLAPGVGAVTCFYVGHGEGPWARLAAMAISYNFLPNAIVGQATGLAHPCFGSTVALRRQTLAEIGGLSRFSNCLADDYEIGRAVRDKGYRLAYPALLVRHHGEERSAAELWRHELRWARTIRTVDPLGYTGSIVTHAFPLGLIGAAVLGFSLAGLATLATVVAARLFLKYRIDHIAGAVAGPVWLLPARDMLSFAVFLASLPGRTVTWGGKRLKIGKGGAIG